MPHACFGLGSNLGDRRRHLVAGIEGLERLGLRRVRISPVVETPALLPDDAPEEWNIPFLNLVVIGEVDADQTPTDWLPHIKSLQDAAGRLDKSRWSPRPLDIDILLWGDERVDAERLQIPHPELTNRAFVVVPLAHLAPQLEHPLLDGVAPLARARTLAHRLPLWMGVVNVTPDSFSDGGRFAKVDAALAQVNELEQAGANIIDLGAESTRPGATPLDADAEWQRLEPVLRGSLDMFEGNRLRPRLSVDTYHPQTAARALEAGLDIVNDVGGLESTEMQRVAADGGEWVAMHNLGLPASRDVVLPPGTDAVAAVSEWLETRLDAWQAAGIDTGRIVFDPGIGFGKHSLQSLDLLRGITAFHRFGLRILVGHSRKSFMHAFSGGPETRDIETLGASLKLCALGVDILRVHDVAMHVRAHRAWAHLDSY